MTRVAPGAVVMAAMPGVVVPVITSTEWPPEARIPLTVSVVLSSWLMVLLLMISRPVIWALPCPV